MHKSYQIELQRRQEYLQAIASRLKSPDQILEFAFYEVAV
jgi:hypothetical protein